MPTDSYVRALACVSTSITVFMRAINVRMVNLTAHITAAAGHAHI